MIRLGNITNLLGDSCGLFAGQAEYIHMGRRFRRGGGAIEWSELLLPAAVIAVVIGIAWLVSYLFKMQETCSTDSPRALFAELCQAHQLDWGSQQLLRALAAAHQLESPVSLFVQPELFDVERLGKSFENRKSQVASLQRQLFDAGRN